MARRISQRRASGRGDDVETWQWVAALRANGGDVTAQRLMIISRFIAAEKAAGTWQATDDYWALWGENEIQALTSLKQKRLATAVAAPTFEVDRGYAFNGTTQYLNTGFVPSTMAVAMMTADARIAAYERTDVGTGTYAVGAHSSTSRSLRANPRSSTPNLIFANAMFGGAQWVLPSNDSRGFTAVSRAPGNIAAAYKNTISLAVSVANTGFGSSLPDIPIYIGAYNLSGTGASGWRASSLGFVCTGASLTPTQELAQYTNVQAWATAVEATV